MIILKALSHFVFRHPSDRQIFARHKTCIFSPAGELLWRSHCWYGEIPDAAKDRLVLGTRWQEFVYPPHLCALLAWFSDGQDCTAYTFCAMAPSSGMMIRVHYVKNRYGPNWIVLGDVDKCFVCEGCEGCSGLRKPL